MSEGTFGEQVYREYIKAGQRTRFSYADVQILKRVESLQELRGLCFANSGEILPDSATARDLLETCVIRHPDQSDAEAAGQFLGGDIGGCVVAIRSAQDSWLHCSLAGYCKSPG